MPGNTRDLRPSKMSSMGSMILRNRIEEEHLTCAICFGSFTRPKALPCLHTFCENCLREYVVGRGFENSGYFPCPICRSNTQMPANGVEGFPDNHLVMSLSDTVESSRKRPVIPPRPRFNLGDGISTGTGISVPQYPPQQTISGRDIGTKLYPELPKLEDLSKPRRSSPTNIPCTKGMLLRFGKYGPSLEEFHHPFGLAVGKNGEYVVSDHGGNRILIFSNSGELRRRAGCDCVVNGLAVTKNNEILVAVTKSRSAIMRNYSMQGHLIKEFGAHYRYEDPCGIAVMSSGNVAVSGMQSMCVYTFTEQYKFSNKFGRKGSGDEHFLTPYFVAADSKDHIIVSDRDNHCIQVFNSMGKFKHRFGSEGYSHGHLCNPMGVCADDQNNIIVADSGNCRVEMFSNKGRYLDCIVEDTCDIGQDVKPTNVAITTQNNVAVLLTGPQFAEVRVYRSKSS